VDDWYGAEKKDYKKYASQYPMNGELGQQDKKIEAMDKWCKQTGIQFTPTFFINGKQLPDNYTITDAGYFLL
jgi:protein-disulfide isomerase